MPKERTPLTAHLVDLHAHDERPLAGRPRKPAAATVAPVAPLRFPPTRDPGVLQLPGKRHPERAIGVNLRIPVSVLDQIEQICNQHDLERTAVMLYLLRSGLRQFSVDDGLEQQTNVTPTGNKGVVSVGQAT